MVLRAVLLIFVSHFFSGSTTLLDKYTKTVSKEIAKTFEGETFDFIDVPFASGELYTLKSLNTKEFKGYVLITEVASCKLGGCSAFLEASDGMSAEYFDALIILDASLKIKKIKILDYFSDYGYEITSKRYLKQFQDLSVCRFSNENDQIDAISGATISSYALEGTLAQLCFLDSI